MVNTLTAQLVGIAKVPLYNWGNQPTNSQQFFDGASFGPVVASGISEGVNGNLVGVNFQRLLPSGGLYSANLGNYTALGALGNVNKFSYFDNAIWASSNFGNNATGFYPGAQANYRFPLPGAIQTSSPIPPQVRASSQVYVNNAATVAVPFPTGSQAGDDCYIFTQHGWPVLTPPAGWTSLGGVQGGGSFTYVLKKNLSIADIAAGSVTVTFQNAYFGFCMALTFVTTTSVISFVQSTTASVTITPSPNAAILWFGACRGNGAVTSNRGATQQTTANNEGSGILTEEVAINTINLTTTFTYPSNSGLVSTGIVIGGGQAVNQGVLLKNFAQIQLDNVFQTNKFGQTEYFPFMWHGRKAGAMWFNGQNPGASLDIWIPSNNSFIIHALDLSQIGFLATYNVAMNRIQAGAATQFNASRYDSVIVRWPGASGVGPAPISPPSVTYVNSTISELATMQIALDNVALNNMFQAVATTPIPTVFPFGFVYVLPITTAGNQGPLTGQTREVLVFNTDLTQYYAIQFVPQDGPSQALLAAGGVNFGSFRWSVAIDEFGVVWITSNAGTTISTSFSPLNFTLPSIQAVPLNPFTLPCYNTCSPVDFAEP